MTVTLPGSPPALARLFQAFAVAIALSPLGCSSTDTSKLFQEQESTGGATSGKADAPGSAGATSAGGSASGGASGTPSGGGPSGGGAAGAPSGGAGGALGAGGSAGSGVGGASGGPASCADHCGGPSEDGSCYCDAACKTYGDCCSDVAVCGEQAGQGCTTALCNSDQPTTSPSGVACYCDVLCLQYGDCCENKPQVCGP